MTNNENAFSPELKKDNHHDDSSAPLDREEKRMESDPLSLHQKEADALLPDDWLDGLNTNQVKELPADWTHTSAFLFAHLRSISPILVFGYPSGKTKLLFKDQQKLERLQCALKEALTQCLDAGITKFIVLLTPDNSYGVVALECLLSMKQTNHDIQIATLVDIIRITYHLDSYFGDRRLKTYLGRLESMIRQSDFILSFEKDAIGHCDLENTYTDFCMQICKTVICYLSGKQMCRENVMKACVNHNIRVINIYPDVNPGPFDHQYRYKSQYIQMQQKKYELTQCIGVCAQNIKDLQKEINRIDNWILEYISSQSYAQGLAHAMDEKNTAQQSSD